MGSCIICGIPVDGGHVCDSHQEDVLFEFRGNHASQLIDNRFYEGTVDGYADFGVFIDLAPGVTGLLHRSELDRRLESLDWEPGDTVCVRVNNVRDNGNIDLGKSIRQSDREFRGKLILDGSEEKLPAELDGDDEAVDTGSETPDEATDGSDEPSETATEPTDSEPADSEEADTETDAAPADDSVTPSHGADTASETEAAVSETVDAGGSGGSAGAVTVTERDADSETAEAYADAEIGSLEDRVDERVRLDGEIVSIRQTGGPTVFELRDETGVVDCAAFVEAGVRAYPEVELGDIVRLDGEVERRRGELQVETDDLVVLEADDREAVEQRLADALTDRARPDGVDPIGDHDAVAAMEESLLDVAEAIRRAVLESRPVVIRHPATADGYVAGAAIERAVLPLVREEHARSDAEYHYIVRRPLDDAVYGMDAATKDATRMLQDRDRHDEKLPLFCFVGAASTADSADGLGLLGVYGAERIVLDSIAAETDVDDAAEQVVTAGGDAADLSVGALTATLAAALNPEVSEDMQHLPAVSYWEDTPEAYTAAAEAAGYDAEQVTNIREAVALEAYYQSYQDKRELITDLLFDDAGGVAGHIAEQFREKLDTELSTAQANLETEERDGVGMAVLDTEQFSHRFDFPSTELLLDELHFTEREGEAFVTAGVGMDELYLRSSRPLDIRAVAEAAAEAVPEAGIAARGIREGRIEFLAGRREAARDAVLDAAAEQFD
ncbi:DHH family phosphoesterase [Halohasta salina]|uniref:DHH family phosphoesterase n=1 Tax=Halohasta salina TaxID=2961621 RepID=UPI0020A3FD63|nr:OB-fold nucleic acid binding domain-containing protein [Halohasta salina]